MKRFGHGTTNGPDESSRCKALPLPQGGRRGSIKSGTVHNRPMQVMGRRQPVTVVIRIIHGRIDRRVPPSGMICLYAMQQDARLHTKAFILVPVRAIATRRLNHYSPFPVLSNGGRPHVEISGENRFRRRCFRNRTKREKARKMPLSTFRYSSHCAVKGEGGDGNISDRLLK